MISPKASSMIRRGSSQNAAGSAALAPEAVRCRHCGGTRLKLSYRRLDKVAVGGSEATQTVFILRCAACEGFTTVCA
ncbi:MAG TPA: hypothetical protein VG406_12580 [Isosphaeraceae bacterium]|nr:hypothetical protein [Isosphaeraceae bacterium]